LIGEYLYPRVEKLVAKDELTGKITGMILEMDNAELLEIMENMDSLKMKVEEAQDVLEKRVSH